MRKLWSRSVIKQITTLVCRYPLGQNAFIETQAFYLSSVPVELLLRVLDLVAIEVEHCVVDER